MDAPVLPRYRFPSKSLDAKSHPTIQVALFGPSRVFGRLGSSEELPVSLILLRGTSVFGLAHNRAGRIARNKCQPQKKERDARRDKRHARRVG